MLGIAPEAVVWGEFVSVQKLSPRSLALWRAILAEVPDSALLFSPPTPTEQPAFIRQLEGSGIDSRHVRFVPRGDSDAAGRARYALVDLVLDTLPYTGGETTMAALDAGIPVVTLAGTRHAERMGASILRHLGIDYLVAPTEADYVARAIALAKDATLRSGVARAVAEKFSAAAATYPVGYTRDLEAALLAAIAGGDADAAARRP
jgi:predicted O-linked N-acetylglucosamine transferase (SPINDLY family)